jgi:predicted nucleic acid-binding protein
LILVDSSVWINYFNGKTTAAVERLDQLLRSELLAIGDLILPEVLQGFVEEREFSAARAVLTRFNVVELGGRQIAIQAAKNLRVLRRAGITIRGTIDTLIATRCIEKRTRTAV